MSGNIVEKPEEPKFRKIRMDNAGFKKKVSDVSGGTDCILGLGLTPDEVDGVDHWVWSGEADVSMDLLKNKLLPLVKKKLESLGPAPQAAAAAPAPSAPPSTAPQSNPLLNNFGSG